MERVMLVVDTHLTRDGDAVLEVHQLQGVRDLFAWLIAEHGCRHGDDGEGFCWISPPRWTWWVGVPNRTWSLGGAVFTLGQWAHRREACTKVAWGCEVGRENLEVFGWAPGEAERAASHIQEY
jgi:hypothetical protein